jgi:hypothetical protein
MCNSSQRYRHHSSLPGRFIGPPFMRPPPKRSIAHPPGSQPIRSNLSIQHQRSRFHGKFHDPPNTLEGMRPPSDRVDPPGHQIAMPHLAGGMVA